MLLIPGSSHVAVVHGNARLSTDEAARARSMRQDKTSLLAIRVDASAIELRASLSVPGVTGLLKKGLDKVYLDKDYKENLY